MSRRRPFYTVMIGALAAIGLALAPACADDPEPEAIAFTEPGTVFEVDVGGEVTIVLESNATTGYAWELETPPLADVVRLVDDVYVEPEDSELVGAGGRQELTFEALGEGTAELSLWYVRSFDDPKEPAERAVFEIIVS
jgi:inhibitor of cysteine peptidase